MILSRLLCLIALVLVTSAAVIDERAPGKAPTRPKATTPVKPRPAKVTKPAKPVATPKQPKGPTPPKPALNVAKVLTFQCQDMPGISCRNYDTRMYWDKEASGRLKEAVNTAARRRRNSGCIRTGGNRCSKPPYGSSFECDEFPFASVEPVASAKPFNRCVPEGHNNKQGTAMLQFYHYSKDGLRKDPDWFEIAFANTQNIKYCAPKPQLDYTNDGNIMYKGEKLVKRDLVARNDALQQDQPHQYYITKRGVNLFMPSGAEIGDVVYSPRSLDGDDGTNFHLDEIVARGNATTSED